jgi:hypothetical protein
MVSVTNRSSLVNPFASPSAASPSVSSASAAAWHPLFSPLLRLTLMTILVSSATTIQTINICSHVFVLLEFDDSNYSQWRCFFDYVLGKFGLTDHVWHPPPLAQRSAEWRQIGHCIVNWLYTTIKKPVFDFFHKPNTSAFTLWGTLKHYSATTNFSELSFTKPSSATFSKVT